MKQQRGFTLVEILVSVAIFALIVTAAIGAIFSMIDASQKARSMSSAMTNLNIALETMSRRIRVGTHYSCVGDSSPCSDLSFKPSVSLGENSDLAQYRLYQGAIQYLDSSNKWVSVTAPEVNIDELRFYVSDSPDSQKQPRVFMTIKGTVSERQQTSSTFYIQTLMTQRILGSR